SVPGGTRASAAEVYQASAPARAKNCTTALLIFGSFSGLPQRLQRKTAMGTPQTRCREMHQSGRVAIMLAMRSSPHAGSHFTFLPSYSGKPLWITPDASTSQVGSSLYLVPV